jgi:Cu/Ag efflux protein CusF
MGGIVRAGVLALALFAAGCGAGEEPEMGPAASDPAAVYAAAGTVIAVGEESLTIDHEPIEALGWPAMTMMFGVEDAAMTESIQAGDRVEFSFRRDGSSNLLTAIEPAE